MFLERLRNRKGASVPEGELKGKSSRSEVRDDVVGEEDVLGFKAIVRTSAFTLSQMGVVTGFETEEGHDLIHV